MLKFVVLCAIIAAATGEPGALLSFPITQYSTVLSPATTTISKQASSVIHPSPFQYYPAAPLAYTHFIKKRSAQYLTPTTYIASTPYGVPISYIASTPYVASTPLIQNALPAVTAISPAVHLIKKRSAPLLPTTYIAPHAYAAASAPILTTYTTGPFIPATKLISQPLVYNHLIKKRSAPLLNTFLAPTAYSTQSRIDLNSAPLSTISYKTPITYATPFTYQHLY